MPPKERDNSVPSTHPLLAILDDAQKGTTRKLLVSPVYMENGIHGRPTLARAYRVRNSEMPVFEETYVDQGSALIRSLDLSKSNLDNLKSPPDPKGWSESTPTPVDAEPDPPEPCPPPVDHFTLAPASAPSTPRGNNCVSRVLCTDSVAAYMIC